MVPPKMRNMNTQFQTSSVNRSSYRKRYKQILSVFARHGFDLTMDKFQQKHRFFQSRKLKNAETSTGLTPAVHLRLALEELGPTFIKLGQILTTRPDLLAPEYIQELSKLQDEVPPAPWEAIRAVITEELGDEPEHKFAKIDLLPLAAASLGEVHAAVLNNGDEVVVKVQRPNIQTVIETDLAILKDLAALAQRTEWGEQNQPAEIAEPFAVSLLNELDYCREGRSADRFRTNFTGDETIHIPIVYWDYSTRRVLVMERLTGMKVDDLPALDKAGYDRKKLALNSVSIISKEVLQYGFYHADPHAGNMVVMSGGVIGLMDFGMMGELSKREHQSLTRLLICASDLDAEDMVNELIRLSVTGSGVIRARLVSDLDQLLQEYAGKTLKEFNFQELMTEFTTLITRHHMSLSAKWWMLIKTVVMMEGLGQQLDPGFDWYSVAKPIAQQMKWQMLVPNADWGKAILRQGKDWGEFLTQLPRASRQLMDKIEYDQPFDFQLRDLEKMVSELGRLINRLSLSIIVAALVVGLSVLIATAANGSPLKILIAIGFLGVLVLSIWLIVSMVRGR